MLFRNVSFEINRGERIAIVGSNGCVKTTLLRVLTGLEGSDLEDIVTHAVNIVGMACRASRKKVNRFLSLLQFSEMDSNQRIETLSGGQRAQVALAQCLLSGAALEE